VAGKDGYQILVKNGADGFKKPAIGSKIFGNTTYGELLNVVKKRVYDKNNSIDLAKLNIPDIPISQTGSGGEPEENNSSSSGVFNGFSFSLPSILEIGG
jgi:hypothetical protein